MRLLLDEVVGGFWRRGEERARAEELFSLLKKPGVSVRIWPAVTDPGQKGPIFVRAFLCFPLSSFFCSCDLPHKMIYWN